MKRSTAKTPEKKVLDARCTPPPVGPSGLTLIGVALNRVRLCVGSPLAMIALKDGNPREGKPPRTPVAITPSGELTCSEGQVEDLLSEGESTEKETPNLRKQPEQKPFPRNIPQVIMPARKWK